MTRIEVDVVSKGLYILKYFLSVAVALTTAFSIAPPQENSTLIFLIVAIPVYLVFQLLTRKLIMGKVVIEMNSEGLKFTWIKQFIFHNRSDITLKWSEIREYDYDISKHLDQFELKLKNGKKIRFNFRSLDEEFLKFYHHLKKLTEVISNAEKEIDITQKIHFFDTPIGQWLTFGLGMLLLGFCGFIIAIRNWDEMNWSAAIALIVLGLMMVFPKIRHLFIKS